ncbi:hypothetical protein A2U01_0046955, partial [Trifolium medium]|nr:hypothetical protein [Trifolium medium]
MSTAAVSELPSSLLSLRRLLSLAVLATATLAGPLRFSHQSTSSSLSVWKLFLFSLRRACVCVVLQNL